MKLIRSPFRREERAAPTLPTPTPQVFTPPSFFVGPTYAGAQVTDDSTLGVPAAWRCCNLIADAIAASPMQAFRSDVLLAQQPAIVKRPNETQTRYDVVHQLVVSLLLRGNAYCLLGDFDSLSYPRQLKVLHPDWVTVMQMPDGSVQYRILGVEIDPAVLTHIKGFLIPGAVQGVGVVAMMREAVSHSISLQEFSARYFAEGAAPPVALVSPDPIDDDEIRRMRDEWVERHGRSRRPPILTDGLDIKPIGFSPEDSQFLESRKFSSLEMALAFGLPPHFVGAPSGDSMTYSNIGAEATNLLKFSLRPWYVRLEQAFSDLLPRGTEVQFNIDAILRADPLTRYQAYSLALGSPKYTGWLTVDEVRAIEGYEPMPPNPEPQVPADNPDVDIDEDDDSEDDDIGPGDTVVAPPSSALTSPTPNAPADAVTVQAHTRKPPVKKVV